MKKEKITAFLIMLQNFILILFPLIFSKRGNQTRNNAILILVILTIVYLIIRKKKIDLDKKIVFYGLGCILFMTISILLLKNDYTAEKFKIYSRNMLAIIFGFCITQIKLKEKTLKYMLPILTISSIFPIWRALNEWYKKGFSINERIFGDNWPTVFAVELGIFLLVSMIVLLYEKNYIIKIVAIFSMILGYVALVGTQTRITILIIPVIYFLILMLKNYKLGIIFSIFFLLIAFLTTAFNFEKYFNRFDLNNSEGSYSNKIRILTYERSIEMIKKSHLLGIGFYNFQDRSLGISPELKKYIIINGEDKIVDPKLPVNESTLRIYADTNSHSHNNLLETLLAQGILGLICYILFYYYMLKNCILNLKNCINGEYKKYFILGFFTIIYLFLNGMVESNIYMEKVNQMTFFILGLALNEKFFCNNKKDNKE